MNSVARITTTVQETPTGFRIQGIEERPQMPTILYDMGDWPLCRAAAELMAAELGFEIAHQYRALGMAVLATYARPSPKS